MKCSSAYGRVPRVRMRASAQKSSPYTPWLRKERPARVPSTARATRKRERAARTGTASMASSTLWYAPFFFSTVFPDETYAFERRLWSPWKANVGYTVNMRPRSYCISSSVSMGVALYVRRTYWRIAAGEMIYACISSQWWIW
eukprot:404066-Prymnesium_polylepis.1